MIFAILKYYVIHWDIVPRLRLHIIHQYNIYRSRVAPRAHAFYTNYMCMFITGIHIKIILIYY